MRQEEGQNVQQDHLQDKQNSRAQLSEAKYSHASTLMFTSNLGALGSKNPTTGDKLISAKSVLRAQPLGSSDHRPVYESM